MSLQTPYRSHLSFDLARELAVNTSMIESSNGLTCDILHTTNHPCDLEEDLLAYYWILGWFDRGRRLGCHVRTVTDCRDFLWTWLVEGTAEMSDRRRATVLFL